MIFCKCKVNKKQPEFDNAMHLLFKNLLPVYIYPDRSTG